MRTHTQLYYSSMYFVLDGLLDGCESKQCDFYSICESEGAIEGRCICPTACEDPKVNISDSTLHLPATAKSKLVAP